MGSRTDAEIAAWQEHAGLKPVIGGRRARLEQLSQSAYELIKVIQLEISGVRDGDGYWRGSDALQGYAENVASAYKRVVQAGDEAEPVTDSPF